MCGSVDVVSGPVGRAVDGPAGAGVSGLVSGRVGAEAPEDERVRAEAHPTAARERGAERPPGARYAARLHRHVPHVVYTFAREATGTGVNGQVESQGLNCRIWAPEHSSHDGHVNSIVIDYRRCAREARTEVVFSRRLSSLRCQSLTQRTQRVIPGSLLICCRTICTDREIQLTIDQLITSSNYKV